MSRFVACLLAGVAVLGQAGCNRTTEPAPAATRRLESGFEIRYNAVVALARRGSPKIDPERIELLKEMLDEPVQLYNWRVRIVEGKEVAFEKAGADPVAARTCVESALKAIVELHHKRPDLDLSALKPAIEKLKQSSNPALRTEAERTYHELIKK